MRVLTQDTACYFVSNRFANHRRTSIYQARNIWCCLVCRSLRRFPIRIAAASHVARNIKDILCCEGKTRQERRVNWYPAAGRVWVSFDDILVPASDTLPRKYVDELEPWDLPNLTPYADEYLSGFQSESYTTDLRGGFNLAKDKMVPEIESKIRWDIGGDEQRIHSKTTVYQNITFKYILLPVWISAYRFKDRSFQFLVNARTGEVQGERPWSWVKITLAALLVISIIGIIVYFANK